MNQQGGLGKQVNAQVMQLDNHPFSAHAQHHQRDNQPWQKAQGLFINLRHRLEHAHQQASLSFSALVQVRNKIATGFNDLMSMSI